MKSSDSEELLSCAKRFGRMNQNQSDDDSANPAAQDIEGPDYPSNYGMERMANILVREPRKGQDTKA